MNVNNPSSHIQTTAHIYSLHCKKEDIQRSDGRYDNLTSPPVGDDIQLQQSESTLRQRGLRSPNGPSRQDHELTHLPYRRWCSVCFKVKHSPHPMIQVCRPVIQIDFAVMSTKEQPGKTVTVFAGTDVRTQMSLAIVVPSKSVNKYGLTELGD